MRDYYYLASGKPKPLESGGGGGSTAFRGPLRVDGLNLKTPDGAIWKYKGHTGFRAVEYGIRGEWGILDDYFGPWSERGANTNRSFSGMWDNTGFNIYRTPNGYDLFERYLEYRKRWGYEHVVFFCNQRQGGPNRLTEAQQDEHVDKMAAACKRQENTIGEIQNEDGDPDNGSISARFRPEQFHGIPMTRSTWYTASNQDPETPGKWMDWVTIHPGRDRDWVYEGPKIGLEAQKMALGDYPAPRKPSLLGEVQRIAEGTTPRQHADHAFHALNFCAGHCVHGGFRSFDPNHETDLQNCRFPSGGSGLECIDAIRDVWQSPLLIDNAAADGAYTRAAVSDQPPYEQNDNECPITHRDRWIHDSEDPKGTGRSYFMRLGSKAIGGPADPGSDHAWQERLGYRLIAKGGYNKDGRGGNVLVLER